MARSEDDIPDPTAGPEPAASGRPKRCYRKRAPKCRPGEIHVFYGYIDGEGPDISMKWHQPAQRGDGNFMLDVFDRETVAELRKRGYDLDTLKFSIRKKAEPSSSS